MNKNELFLSKIKEEQQKLQNNNYLGVIDERKTRIDALVKALTILEFDEEIEILLRQKDLLTTLANQEPKWKTEMNKYVDDSVSDIGYFINVKSAESHRKRNIDEEM